MLPSGLPDFQRSADMRETSYKELIPAVLAGWKHDIPEIIPTALYLLCRDHYSEIREWGSSTDTGIARVTALCAYGHLKLLRLKRTVIRKVTQVATGRDGAFLTFHCYEELRSELIAVMTDDKKNDDIHIQDEEDVDIFSPDGCLNQIQPLGDSGVCSKCRSRWMCWENEAQEDAWRKMPESFGLEWPEGDNI
jgi:hypothetical protein